MVPILLSRAKALKTTHLLRSHFPVLIMVNCCLLARINNGKRPLKANLVKLLHLAYTPKAVNKLIMLICIFLFRWQVRNESKLF